MVRTKVLGLIILSCAIMTCKPAKAFWPVMDFSEVPVIISKVTTALDALAENKEQLMKMNGALEAMGKSIDNIAQFGQDLRGLTKDIQDVANNTVDGVNENLGTDIEIPESVNNGFTVTNEALGDGLGDIVNQTQDTLKFGEDIIDESASGIDTAQKGANQANEGLKKLEEKNEEEKAKREEKQSQTEEPVEEEEEEEEIAEDTNDIMKEEIMVNIDAFESESKQLIAQMNDVLDTAINTLNKSAQNTQKLLDNLGQTVRATEQLEESDKEALLQRIEKLKTQHRNISDKTIAIVENAKETYNQEYEDKLIDGLVNYRNTVEMYLRGDISKEIVIKKGEELKLAVKQIDTTIDKETLEMQNQETENIKKEIKAIAAEIGAKKKR